VESEEEDPKHKASTSTAGPGRASRRLAAFRSKSTRRSAKPKKRVKRLEEEEGKY
jgi:hypothetical protein